MFLSAPAGFEAVFSHLDLHRTRIKDVFVCLVEGGKIFRARLRVVMAQVSSCQVCGCWGVDRRSSGPGTAQR